MADAEDLARELAQARAERHVEALEHDLAERVGVVALGHQRPRSATSCIRPDRRTGSRGPRRAPRGASLRLPVVAREHVGEALRRAASRAPRAGRRAGWSPACTGSSRSRWSRSSRSQSQYERGSFAACRRGERLGADRVERQARRQHQPLLRAADGDVDAPFVVAVVDRAERARSCRPCSSAGWPARSIAARIGAMRDVTPVDVSLWTTQHRLDRVLAGPRRASPRSRAGSTPWRQSPGTKSTTRPSRSRHLAATASRSGRSRTSARGRRATAC